MSSLPAGYCSASAMLVYMGFPMYVVLCARNEKARRPSCLPVYRFLGSGTDSSIASFSQTWRQHARSTFPTATERLRAVGTGTAAMDSKITPPESTQNPHVCVCVCVCIQGRGGRPRHAHAHAKRRHFFPEATRARQHARTTKGARRGKARRRQMKPPPRFHILAQQNYEPKLRYNSTLLCMGKHMTQYYRTSYDTRNT